MIDALKKYGLLFMLLLSPALHAGELSSVQTDSIYQLNAALTDQDGQKVGLNVFQGHQVVITMFYSSCNYTCPILVDALKKMEASLNSTEREKTRFLLVSFDPETDKPEVLKKLAVLHHLDLKRWKLASASVAQTQEIAALLDIKYRKLSQGGFNHTTVLSVLDPQGAIALREEGLLDAANSLIQRLNGTKDS